MGTEDVENMKNTLPETGFQCIIIKKDSLKKRKNAGELQTGREQRRWMVYEKKRD